MEGQMWIDWSSRTWNEELGSACMYEIKSNITFEGEKKLRWWLAHFKSENNKYNMIMIASYQFKCKLKGKLIEFLEPINLDWDEWKRMKHKFEIKLAHFAFR